MLRIIGALLIVTGAAGALLAFEQALRPYHMIEEAYAILFGFCGIATGFMLVRRNPPRRGLLFWIAIPCLVLLAPLAIIWMGITIAAPFMGVDFANIMSGFFLADWYTYGGWWPPKQRTFEQAAYLLFGFRDFSPTTLLGVALAIADRIAMSVTVWIWIPLATCLWAIWGRPGSKWDRVFALLVLAPTVLLPITTAETAWLDLELRAAAASSDSPLDPLFWPVFYWYACYALAFLSLTALSILLSRRGAEKANLPA